MWVSIKNLPAICKDAAVANGWDITPDRVPEMIALIHSEASEALEAFRGNEKISWTEHNEECNKQDPYSACLRNGCKPQGIASEFADIVIRVAHYSAVLGIDLDAEISRKLIFNAQRGFKHGGKKI